MSEKGHRDRGQSDADARRSDLDGRLTDLKRRMAERQPKREAQQAADANARGYAQAMRLSSEFIAGIVVGGALGWGFDELAGTRPFGLIILLLLGFAAGVVNVLRAVGRMSETEFTTRRNQKKDGPAS